MDEKTTARVVVEGMASLGVDVYTLKEALVREARAAFEQAAKNTEIRSMGPVVGYALLVSEKANRCLAAVDILAAAAEDLAGERRERQLREREGEG